MTPCARGDKRRTENSQSNPISLPSQRSHRATALPGTATAFNGTPSQINTRHRDERLWDGDLKKTGGLVGSKETDRARGNHGNAAVTRRGKINKIRKLSFGPILCFKCQRQRGNDDTKSVTDSQLWQCVTHCSGNRKHWHVL